MEIATPRLELLLDLIEDNSTIAEASDFLRERDLTHSASSWDQMRDERIRPALASGDLDVVDLFELLRRGEDYGKQHIFLYVPRTGTDFTFPSRDSVRAALAERDQEVILEEPLVLDKPDNPTMADARWEIDDDHQYFILKVVETRIYEEKIGERETGSNEYVKRYRRVPMRAINVFRLRDDGLLELRIHSHRNSTQYGDDRTRQWELVDGLLSRDEYTPLSLTPAKNAIWSNRDELGGIVRYSDSRFRDRDGYTVSAATDRKESSLHTGPAVVRSLDEFAQSDSYCDRANIWFLEQSPGPPNRNIHVILDGQINEFAVPRNSCSKADYDYVLDQLLSFNDDH